MLLAQLHDIRYLNKNKNLFCTLLSFSMTRELLIFYLNALTIKSEDKLLALQTGTKILSTNNKNVYLICFTLIL